MNLQPFYDLRERLHTAANAGVNLITEDFRLKRAQEAIAPFAKTSPVFQRIDLMVKKLMEPSCQNRSMVLLDTLALLDAVLTTQGTSGAAGELEPLGDHADDEGFFVHYKDISSGVLRPLKEAMTTTGGGRYNVIQDAHTAAPEVFDDYRIRSLLVDSLGDSYSEIAGMAAGWLKEKGPEIIPILKKGFDPKGKKEMVHRVNIIAELAGAGENAFYLEQIPKSAKEVKEVLIESLRFDKGNTKYLMDLTKSEKGKAATCAKWALSFMDYEDIQSCYAESKGMSRDELEDYAYWSDKAYSLKDSLEVLQDSTQEWVADFLAEGFVREVREIAENPAELVKQKDWSCMNSYFWAVRGKATRKFGYMCENLAAMSKALSNKKTEKGQKLEFATRNFSKSLSIIIADTLVKVACDNREFLPEMADAVRRLYKQYGEDYLSAVFAADLVTRPADEVFDTYGDYLNTKGALEIVKKVKKKQSAEILAVLALVEYNRKTQKYTYSYSQTNSWKGEYRNGLSYELKNGLDLRWYPLLFHYEWKKEINTQRMIGYYSYKGFDGIMRALFRVDTPELQELYGQYYYQKCKDTSSYNIYLELLRECKWRHYRGILRTHLLNNKNTNWAVYAVRRIPEVLGMTKEEVIQEMEDARALITDPNSTAAVRINNWLARLKSGTELNELI